MITTIKYWLKCIQEYPKLEEAHQYLKREWTEQLKVIRDSHHDSKKLKDQINSQKNLIINLERQVPNSKEEQFFTKKHPKKNINYKRHETDDSYSIDVRSFNMPNYAYPKFQGSNDQKMRQILIWVIENVKYVGDKDEYNYEEYWAFPYQTIKRGKGDCEDGSILIWNIAIANKIPYYRLRLNAGWVKEPYGTKVGHAYVTYFRESDNKAVVLDWCYYPNYAKILERKTHKEERDYYEIWWSTDTKYSYANKRYLDKMPEEEFEVTATKTSR